MVGHDKTSVGETIGLEKWKCIVLKFPSPNLLSSTNFTKKIQYVLTVRALNLTCILVVCHGCVMFHVYMHVSVYVCIYVCVVALHLLSVSHLLILNVAQCFPVHL